MTEAPPLARALPTALAALAVAGALGVLWLPDALSGQDGASHIVTVSAALHPERHQGLLVAGWAPTGQIFHGLAWVFGHVLPLMAAAKAALTVFLGLACVGAWLVARALGTDSRAAIAVAAAAVVGWPLAMGFYNFIGACAVGVLAFAATLRGRNALAALLLFVVAWAHTVAGLMFVVHTAAHAVFASPALWKPQRRWLTWIAPLVGIVALTRLVVGNHADVGTGDLAHHYLTAAETLAGYVSLCFVGYSRVAWVLAPALVVVVAVAAARRDVTRVVAATLACWTVGFAVVPFHVAGWAFATPRILSVVHTLLGAAVPSRTLGGWAPVLVTLLAAAATLDGVAHAVEAGGRAGDAIDAFGDEPSGRTFIAVFEPRPADTIAPHAQPLIGVGGYATLNGGTYPGAFAIYPHYHSVLFAAPPNQLFPSTRDMFFLVESPCDAATPACAETVARWTDRIAAQAVHWDSVALVAAPDAVRNGLAARGFDFSAPGLAKPRPAQVTFALPQGAGAVDGAGGPATTIARAGYLETVGWFLVRRWSAETVATGEPLTLGPLPAGETAVQVFVDLDDNGEPNPGEPLLFQRVLPLRPGQMINVESGGP